MEPGAAMILRAIGPLAAAFVFVAGCGGASDAVETGEASSCTLAGVGGDGFGVRRTSLAGTGGDLEITWSTTGPVPADGTVRFAVEATDFDEQERRNLVVEYSEGAQAALYVEGGDSGRTDLEGMAERDATSVRAVFPGEEIEPLGSSFWWRSTSSVGGEVVDVCPDPGEDPANPELATFPN